MCGSGGIRVWKWGNCVGKCRNVVGKSGNMVSERLNSVRKQEISIGNGCNRIRKVVDWVRKTLYLCRKTGCLYLKTPQIKPENEWFISPTAVYAPSNRSTAQPFRRNLTENRRFMFPNRRIELLFRRFGTIFSLLWTRETWISRIETAEKSVWYVEFVFWKRVMSVRRCVIVFGKWWNYVFERWNGIGELGNGVIEISKLCSESG